MSDTKQKNTNGGAIGWFVRNETVKGFAFGGIASCVAETATIPMDVVKTRMQIQSSTKMSTWQVGVQAVRQEGVGALFKGLTPALLRQSTYGSLRYGCYEPIKKVLGTNPDGSTTLLKKVIAGSLSGAAASAICNPTDLIKVRMQADSGPVPRYSGIVDAARQIFRQEGPLGFYKGVGPTTGRATVLAAAELASYDEVKTQLLARGIIGENVYGHFTSSLCAGFISTLASSPFDVVKSRVMSQPFDASGRGTLYSGMIDCFAKSIRTDGILSLWKGFWPNFGRVGPRVVIVFTVMEKLKSAAKDTASRLDAEAES
eukprot:GFYU01017682.1.p1 GENE.GFYU01017682.1~~GFYU01017682.1.p1  ORF type:complete len:315 (-),score=81.12 GFYU01017682.1:483-1427(-)